MAETRAAKSRLIELRPGVPVLAGLALAGLVLILYVHHWSVTASMVFLTFAWLGILGSGYYLWTAGLILAADEGESEGFHHSRSRAEDLLLEKQSLLKAIKEVEFDHMMGKMSDQDASELSQAYRRRAVEILKALDSDSSGDDETLSIADKIERDIRARAKVGSVAAKARKRAQSAAAKKKQKAAASKVRAARKPEPEPEPAPAVEEEE